MKPARHLSRWILVLVAVFCLVYAGAIQMARGRATAAWDELGQAFGEWLHEHPSRMRGVRQVVPTLAGMRWVGLEGTISWPGHRLEAQGSLLHAHREVRWLQRDKGFSVLARQDRHMLAACTHVRLSGKSAPPEKLVKALRELLGEDEVEVVVEP